jgi:diguanylate cyclase (GGDEF)-like protein
MKRNAAKPRRKAAASPRQRVRAAHLRADAPLAEASKPKRAVRSTSMQLAAEVERLLAELEHSRARIVDLEAKVDIDPLTDLFNRRGFERELKRSVAYVKRYGVSAALIFLDLDGFKPVNDRHGHAAGDAVLKAVAAAIVAEVRASDIAARIGGDEFAVLLWNVSDAAATAKAAALERAVYATPVQWGASTLVVGASAGVALAGALDSPGELLARADAAMYARKHARRAEPREQDAPVARPAANLTQ